MNLLVSWFSESGFMPHGHCYLWQPGLVWLHVVSDTVIGLAYLSISLSLYLLVRKIRLPFSWVFLAFGLFIFACGLTHFMEVWTMWKPHYWVAGGIKALTAAASITTAVLLFPLAPRVVLIARETKLAEERRLLLESHSVELERRVAERTAALEAALESEKYTRALFEAVIENSPIGIGLLDRDIRFTHVNWTMATLNGLEPAVHAGKRPSDLLPGVDEIKRVEEAFRGVAVSGVSLTGIEVAGETPARPGERRIWSESVYPIRVDDEVRGIAVLAQDVTEQRQTEERFRHMAEAIPSIVRITNPNGDVVYFNQHWYQFTGATPAQSLGRGWLSFVHDEDRAHAADMWDKAVKTSTPAMLEYRVRNQSGTYHWLLSRTVPIAGQDGKPVNWYGVATDIDDQKRAIVLRDEFLSFASHELRTPLAAFALRVETLQRQAGAGKLANLSPKELAETFQSIVAQVRRLGALTDQLLDVSRFTTGQLHLHFERVDVAALLSELAGQFHDMAAHEYGGEVRFTNHAGHLEAEVDRERFAQLVTNLLTNAIKFGAHKPIDVELRPEAGAFRLVVRDYGVGIAPVDQAKIFERFTRATENRAIGGLGLGLFIVREIVERHHGRVSVESRENEGATFSVTLPLRQPTATI